MPEQKPCAAVLPPGFTARPVTAADGAVVTDLLNDYIELAIGMRKVTEDDIRSLFGLPEFDAANSTRVVLSPQGQAAGAAIVTDIAAPPVHPSVVGCVGAGFERQGIGTYLVDWAIERGRQAVARVPEGARVSLYFTLPGQHEPTRRLFEKYAMQVVRHSWLMVIDLEQEPPAPHWPQGIVVRTFQERPDLSAVYRAVHEAFRDHWGYVDRPEEEGVQRMQHSIANDPTFDPSLWFLAMAGEEIAGMALCRAQMGEDPSTSVVETLGVRRPWRCQGLGLSLLHHAFGEFYRRGQRHVGLGVDAGSLTGATRLYQKAGMHVAQQVSVCEVELRPGQELGRQALD
jgi:ribosomal protein S18 acetylase RimI-like enzyme